MAIGRPGKLVGNVGRRVKRTGTHGRDKSRHGSALTLDQDKTKVAYPTTTTTT